MQEDSNTVLAYTCATEDGRPVNAFIPVNMRSIDWVIDHAPVPHELTGVLLVIARCCNDEGRGSAQSVSTIATKAGKSEGQTRRDIARLRQLGLLLVGDQAIVENLPRGQRPVVYDLPLSVSGPKPAREPRNRAPRVSPEGARRQPIPTGVRLAVFLRDGDACVQCGETDDLTLDHIHPWALGGPDTVENLRVLCRSCNSRKGARTEAGA